MTESPESASPEQVVESNPVARFLNEKADKLEAWAGERATKKDVATAVVLTATGVMGIGAAIKYGPSAVDKARDVAEFASTAIDYITLGAQDAQSVGELMSEVISRTSDVATGVSLGVCLEAGEEIIATMSGEQVASTANIGAAYLIGASAGAGFGLDVIAESRMKGTDKPLLRSTHVVPVVAKALRVLANVSEHTRQKS